MPASLVISNAGAWSTYGRLIAPYMSKHLPGHPVIVVQGMPGAGGIIGGAGGIGGRGAASEGGIGRVGGEYIG